MRADRLLSLLLLQMRGRMTALDLAQRLGVSERTIPVTFERVDDAHRALLGCGTLGEVVEPREPRASIATAAAGVAALYAQ